MVCEIHAVDIRNSLLHLQATNQQLWKIIAITTIIQNGSTLEQQHVKLILLI